MLTKFQLSTSNIRIDNNWEISDELSHVPDGYLDELHISGILERIPHPDLYEAFCLWRSKLQHKAILTITVLDLAWIARQIIRFEAGQVLTGVYCDFEDKRGLQSLLFGTHKTPDDVFCSGFTRRSLHEWLEGMEFKSIKIENYETKEGVGMLKATCINK